MPVSVGAVRSTRTTVTVKLPCDLLPFPSFAEQLTVVVPRRKGEPEAGMQVGKIDPATMSDAVAAYPTVRPLGSSVSSCWFDGRLNVGEVVSTTVTPKVAGVGVVFPWSSVAVQLTEVVPTGNVLPEEGAQLTVGERSTLSVAAIAQVTAAPPGPVASVGDGLGTSVKLGGSSSTKVTTT